MTHCRYEVVRKLSRRYGLNEVNEEQQWNIYWTDFSVSIERAKDMRRYQVRPYKVFILNMDDCYSKVHVSKIINHFPGMSEICRKDLLARNMNRMKKLFGQEYDIYPKTWSLPAE